MSGGTGLKAAVVWWDLAGTGRTAESLRAFLREEAVDRFARVEGLRLKFWISDPATNRWGAVLLWESADAAEAPLPARAAELIGRPPAERTLFDVEATVEGVHTLERLAGHGIALASPAR
jgi:trans-2,3-dihydro-3-hydroxyanthranilate isomerase